MLLVGRMWHTSRLFCGERHENASARICFLYRLVNKRSDTDLGNTQSEPRGGERATVS